MEAHLGGILGDGGALVVRGEDLEDALNHLDRERFADVVQREVIVLDYLETSDAVVVMNGDTLLPAANVSRLLRRWHAVEGVKGLLAAVEVEDGQARGGLVCDVDGRVTAFMEKTVAGNVMVNGGVYVFERSALAALERGTVCSLEYAIFPDWVKHGQLLAEPVDGPLLDMGTPAGLAETEAWCLAQNEVEADRGS